MTVNLGFKQINTEALLFSPEASPKNRVLEMLLK
jgi:hypothetical protein